MSPTEIIEREQHWARLAALLSIFGVVLFAVSLVLVASDYSSDGNAELLRKVDEDSGSLIFAYVIRAVGVALLAVPLLYLFQAALARSDRMRSQLVGLTIAGPLFLAGLAIFTALSLKDAAPDFVAKAAAMGLGTGEHADEVATDVVEQSSLADFATGFGIAGTLGFALALAYSCFHAMRVGLLTRFWGSLGAALGVASILLGLEFPLLYFIYLGLLIGGWAPGGRPPAWAEGRAIPWPTPGEQAAQTLEGGNEGGGDDDDSGVGTGEAGATEGAANPSRPAGERRKRKRRQ